MHTTVQWYDGRNFKWFRLYIEEVLKDAIKPYAFYASEYPLILSIENHCSKKQQDRMAEHFKNILGKEVYENISDI